MKKLKKTIAKEIIFLFVIFLFQKISYAQGFVRERILFNANWHFQKEDPSEAVVKGDSGKIVKRIFDYANVKEWICATGAEFIIPSDSVQAAKRPAGNLGASVTYTQPGFDDSGWRMLNLPHDWGIEGDFDIDLPGNTGKLPWEGIGWYRKHFNIPASDKGRQVFIELDGAMAYPMVWLNGQFVGGWPYGYSSFRLDLSPYIKPGAHNVLAIRLSNPENSSRWYPGSGIYRNVWLVKTSKVHIGHWGTYITTPEVNPNAAAVDLKVTIDNKSLSKAGVKISTTIFEQDTHGNKVGKAVAFFDAVKGDVNPNQQKLFTTKATIKKPKLWDPENPCLYLAVTTIEQEGKIIDNYETPFGVRTVRFDPDQGCLLNGKRVEIKGVCNHHDLGALGIAFNTRAAQRQLEILKEMGVNALRTSHNMPAPELLDLCDRMGILVMDESFDCWKLKKTDNDYHLLFDDWHARDLRAEVRRDRNHPSVIQWSIGNEVRELRTPGGPAIAAKLTLIVNGEDPTRPTVIGSNSTTAPFNGFQKSVGVYGQNYHTEVYSKFKKENPSIPFIGSETSSCVSSRGEYYFPVTNNKAEGLGHFQVSSYDLYAPRWAYSPDVQFEAMDKNPFVGGEFVWTGFDYLGEPTPFDDDMTNLLNVTDPSEKAKMEEELKTLGKIKTPSRSSYFGIVDLCGFKKDRFYMYQARWRPSLAMAHILPHWNWPERVGQNTPIHVYTSGDEAELFLNGKSLGRKKKELYQYRLRWDSVIYQPGEVKVIAYKNGQKWAEDMVKTSGAAAKLSLKADRDVIAADGTDLSFVTVTIIDNEGLLVPRSQNLVRFQVSGPGEIVGVDNGDATSFESFKAKEHKTFNGMALVIIRSKAGETGNITLKAISDGLQENNIIIQSQKL